MSQKIKQRIMNYVITNGFKVESSAFAFVCLEISNLLKLEISTLLKLENSCLLLFTEGLKFQALEGLKSNVKTDDSSLRHQKFILKLSDL